MIGQHLRHLENSAIAHKAIARANQTKRNCKRFDVNATLTMQTLLKLNYESGKKLDDGEVAKLADKAYDVARAMDEASLRQSIIPSVARLYDGKEKPNTKKPTGKV